MANTAAEVVGNNNSSGNQVSGSNSSKPTKYPSLFYSPDYQQLFNKEIKEITMELLQTAESALSSFDYKTIQTLQDSGPLVQYDDFGKIISITPREEKGLVLPQTNPDIANNIFELSELVVSPIKDALQIRPNIAYSSILSNYGYYRSGPDIVKYKPGYSASGSPYYDLEVSVTDPDSVVLYNIYIIEEVE
jgi:hypothetical protein